MQLWLVDQFVYAHLGQQLGMDAHWALRLWSRHAMVFRQVRHFCHILLALGNRRNGL